MVVEVFACLDEALVDECSIFDLAVFERVNIVQREEGCVLITKRLVSEVLWTESIEI